MSEGQVTLHVRGVAHAGSLSIAKGVLDFKSGSGASLRLGLHQIARATADGERVCLVTHTCKLYLLVFPSGVVARRAEEALSREPAQPVLPPAAALPVADTHGHGWQLYHHATEHLRVFGAQLGTPKSPFRMSAVNAQYQVCSTYPFLLVVPAAVTDDALLACAKFRSRGRFAALTWRHPVTGATLSRCAQPLVGFSLGTSVRCDADEALIAALRKTQHANATLHIVDCRPAINAHANKVMGGGTENLAFYPGCTLEQLSLVNIHKVRDAFDALQLCCATAIKAEFGYVEAGVVVAVSGVTVQPRTVLKTPRAGRRSLPLHGGPVALAQLHHGHLARCPAHRVAFVCEGRQRKRLPSARALQVRFRACFALWFPS